MAFFLESCNPPPRCACRVHRTAGGANCKACSGICDCDCSCPATFVPGVCAADGLHCTSTGDRCPLGCELCKPGFTLGFGGRAVGDSANGTRVRAARVVRSCMITIYCSRLKEHDNMGLSRRRTPFSTTAHEELLSDSLRGFLHLARAGRSDPHR